MTGLGGNARDFAASERTTRPASDREAAASSPEIRARRRPASSSPPDVLWPAGSCQPGAQMTAAATSKSNFAGTSFLSGRRIQDTRGTPITEQMSAGAMTYRRASAGGPARRPSGTITSKSLQAAGALPPARAFVAVSRLHHTPRRDRSFSARRSNRHCREHAGSAAP